MIWRGRFVSDAALSTLVKAARRADRRQRPRAALHRDPARPRLPLRRAGDRREADPAAAALRLRAPPPAASVARPFAGDRGPAVRQLLRSTRERRDRRRRHRGDHHRSRAVSLVHGHRPQHRLRPARSAAGSDAARRRAAGRLRGRGQPEPRRRPGPRPCAADRRRHRPACLGRALRLRPTRACSRCSTGSPRRSSARCSRRCSPPSTAAPCARRPRTAAAWELFVEAQGLLARRRAGRRTPRRGGCSRRRWPGAGTRAGRGRASRSPICGTLTYGWTADPDLSRCRACTRDPRGRRRRDRGLGLVGARARCSWSPATTTARSPTCATRPAAQPVLGACERHADARARLRRRLARRRWPRRRARTALSPSDGRAAIWLDAEASRISFSVDYGAGARRRPPGHDPAA